MREYALLEKRLACNPLKRGHRKGAARRDGCRGHCDGLFRTASPRSWKQDDDAYCGHFRTGPWNHGGLVDLWQKNDRRHRGVKLDLLPILGSPPAHIRRRTRAHGTWSTGSLNATGLAAINKTGTTQLRVSFNLDDNAGTGTDYLGYYSGENGTAANRPQLVVTYQ